MKRIVQYIETIVRNQDKRAYDALQSVFPIHQLGFEYEVLVFEVTGRCPCARGRDCSVHDIQSTDKQPTTVQPSMVQEPLFPEPVKPEDQVLKALALIKKYQDRPDVLDKIQQSLAHWRSKIQNQCELSNPASQPTVQSPITNAANNKQSGSENGLNSSSVREGLIDRLNKLESAKSTESSQAHELNKQILNKHELPRSPVHQEAHTPPNKILKAADDSNKTARVQYTNQMTLYSDCLPYPKHFDVIAISSPCSYQHFKNNTNCVLSFANPNLLPNVSLAHKIFIYRQNELASGVQDSAVKFLTSNGWSFHIGNTMVRVTSVLDTPIEITPFVRESQEPEINCRFIPSKEALSRLGGREQNFFFQIVAARESFPDWFNLTVSHSALTSEAVRRKLLASFSSTRNGIADTDDDPCMDAREVSLRCPLTLCRLRNPARGVNCRHFQCFELETFLDIYLSRSSRPCPICSADIPLHQLAVDRFVFDLIGQVGSDCLSVIFDKTGNWAPAHSEQEALVVDNFESHTCDIIDLT